MVAVRHDRLPLTYAESRARFRRAAVDAGVAVDGHAIDAPGADGARLTIDVVRLGVADADRVLLVLGGVHGVEGFAPSALQAELPARWGGELPPGVAVGIVHAVNPWGMAWWRRQNESNVDLNRNWRRDDGVPFENAAYDELHALACPDGDELPDVSSMLADAQALIEQRGLEWVRDGITVGQYRHADGLHFGGDRTEPSNRILERVIPALVGRASKVLTVDLHTGHGAYATFTALCNQPPDSAQARFLETWCDRVEATTGNPEATTALKAGQIANGFAELFPEATCFATSLEIGTADDIAQLAATYQEQWVHRRGDRDDPWSREAIWTYRCCFTPDDPAWERAALTGGRAHLDRALAAVAGWA